MKKQLLIIATLDTKGREAAYVKDCVQECDVNPMLMDIGIIGDPLAPPDFTRQEIAAAAGYTLHQFIKNGDRSGAVQAVQKGGAMLASRLLAKGKLHGVFGMGGGTGTAIVTAIMRALPFGIPKVVVSTVASRDVREYVGTKDIAMFHSVADILGFNDFLRLILRQASYAVCGMMKAGSVVSHERPMVAVTAYGINSACALQAEPLLQKRGYEMIAFHANGCGGMAMEEFIEQRLVAGVIDFTPHEIVDEMFGGYCKGIGSTRLETAGKMGIPLLFAPGGLDNAVFSPTYPMPESFKDRKVYTHDIRFCVRMGADEMKILARIIGEKLNKSQGATYILIPKQGWSEADKPGKELFDPQADQVFIDELKTVLKYAIPIEVMDAHISDPVFAQHAVEILDGMIRSQKT